MDIIHKPSPNFDSRGGQIVDMLVLHYTGMKTAQEALDRLCDPTAKVSAHYVVDEDGSIYNLVDEKNRAWHAGVSSWRGNTNINQRSIGIEIVNPGHEFGYRPFTPAQMKSVTLLCRDILSRNAIPARNVVAHSDVAPTRKEDPGELFDWKTLADFEVGIWPKSGPRLAQNWSEDEIRKSLGAYGYDTTDLPKTIIAFQRRFRPKPLNSEWDHECTQLLQTLLDTVR